MLLVYSFLFFSPKQSIVLKNGQKIRPDQRGRLSPSGLNYKVYPKELTLKKSHIVIVKTAGNLKCIEQPALLNFKSTFRLFKAVMLKMLIN